MSPEQHPRIDQPAMQSAVETLQETIRAQYPSAAFHISEGEDPDGVYVQPLVDVNDVTEVLDAVTDLLFHYQVEEGLPIYVLPRRPLPRVLRALEAQDATNRQRGAVSRGAVHSRPGVAR